MRRLAVVALLALVPAVPARAATPHVIVSVAFSFEPGDITISRGESVTLVNADPAAHDVTAYYTAGGEPVFRSATINLPGQTADVTGVSSLGPGAYPFYCSVHPEMWGSIVVQ